MVLNAKNNMMRYYQVTFPRIFQEFQNVCKNSRLFIIITEACDLVHV